MIRRNRVASLLATTLVSLPAPAAEFAPHSPFAVAFSPDGRTVVVSDRTAHTLAVVDASARSVQRTIALAGAPTGLVWAADGSAVFVAEHGAGTVAVVDPRAGRVTRRLSVGPYPVGLALAARRNLLLVANSGRNTVSILDLADGKERATVPVPRHPHFLAITADESLAVVGNLLPAGPATDPKTAAAVSLIRLADLTHLADVPLPPGSTGLRGVAVSPDGRWAYVAHTVGRFNVPTTQLDRGWVNTNGFSVVDLRQRSVYATLLLDTLARGAANPWDAAVSPDGATLWITLSGVHQLARVDLARLHALLAGNLDDPAAAADQPGRSIWQEIRQDPSRRANLVNDLAALGAARLVERIPLPGRGPRGLALSSDGRHLAAALYFAGSVALLDTDTGKLAGTVSLGDDATPDLARRGEIAFHDATVCFQSWLSCATCHVDGRVDGLNWDLLNDGLGNPKNVRSLLWAHRTPPLLARGLFADLDACLPAEFRNVLFRQLDPERVDAVRAYVRSLEPQPSPYRGPDGDLSAAARRGQTVFESEAAKCMKCHPAPLFTVMKVQGVGTRGPFDHAPAFDTPTLVELWRTGPYLHDGSAATLRDLLTTANRDDHHGATSHLTEAQIDDLVAYLLSL